MTDPVGVAQDPRPVLMMGDEPDTARELLALADEYAKVAYCSHSYTRAKNHEVRQRLEDAIRAALDTQP